MWRVWNSLAKGFRYNAASARNGALIPEEERDVSLSLWSKCDTLKGHTSQCQQNYHTERNNVNKEVPSYKWKNCVDNASFLEIIGLSSALALGWQVSHFNWSNKTQPVPLEKRWSLQIPAFAQLNYPETRLNVLGKKHLSAKTAENSSNSQTVSEDDPKPSNASTGKSTCLDEAEAEQIMDHIMLNIEKDHKARKAELLNEAGFQLLSAHQKEETSPYDRWISHKIKNKRTSYVSQAFLCFQESRRLGSKKGAFNLGLCHEQGFGTCINLEKAAECYEEAAELGHAGAQYNLGLLHYQEKLQGSDQAKGVRFIRKAAIQGLDHAWSTLLIVLQNATENSSPVITPPRSTAENVNQGLLSSASSHFRKSRSEPHCYLSDPADDFDKPFVLSQNVSTSFYVGTN